MASDATAELDFFLVLTLASHRGWLLVKQCFEEADVDPASWGLLPHIAHHGAATPSQLASETGVTTTTIRDQLQGLVDRGLIIRRANEEDRRSYLVALTRAGRGALARGNKATQRAMAELESELGEDLEPLRQSLLKLVEAARRARLRERAKSQ